MLNNRQVLISFILQEKIMLGFVYEVSDPRPAVPRTPNQARIHSAVEIGALPISVEAVADLTNFLRVGGQQRVITRLREVLGGPVQRFDQRQLTVNDQRFL